MIRTFGAFRARVLATLPVLALLILPLMAGPLGAHGSTQRPASRVYTCRFEQPNSPMCVDAWAVNAQALYDWMEVNLGDVGGRHQELIPDGQLCSAGRAKYAAFDRPGEWPITALTTDGSGAVDLVYENTAPHATAYYRVYITDTGFDARTDTLGWGDLDLVYDSGPLDRAAVHTMRAPLPDRTTPAVLYIVWQRSDSPEAFYACSDVTVNAGSVTPPSSSTPPQQSTTTSPPSTNPPTTSPPATNPRSTNPPATVPSTAGQTTTSQDPGSTPTTPVDTAQPTTEPATSEQSPTTPVATTSLVVTSQSTTTSPATSDSATSASTADKPAETPSTDSTAAPAPADSSSSASPSLVPVQASPATDTKPDGSDRGDDSVRGDGDGDNSVTVEDPGPLEQVAAPTADAPAENGRTPLGLAMIGLGSIGLVLMGVGLRWPNRMFP